MLHYNSSGQRLPLTMCMHSAKYNQATSLAEASRQNRNVNYHLIIITIMIILITHFYMELTLTTVVSGLNET